ncbi:MAG: class I SAM-dependent methyltransferase, partial [Candidatus Omnitrophica bacterium]|nr:class I SAM-dependent methyltransferase [Candidatus Omnitrophota bacterium]
NPNGVIPYPEGTFDFIYSNQVIEHVEDLNKVLSEMHRVLKNNGVMMHVFPLKRYFIEGHCGIPFMHWLPKNSWFRKKLVRVFYNCGFGHNRNRDTKREEWINTVIDFVDNYCFYRSEQEIVKKFKLKFKIERYEKHKLLYHLSQKKGLTIKFFSCVARLTPGCILSFLRSFQGSIVLVCKK